MSSHSPAKKAITGTQASASGDSLTIPREASALPTMAAGAASTPKINCFEVENKAKNRIGKIDPYSP